PARQRGGRGGRAAADIPTEERPAPGTRLCRHLRGRAHRHDDPAAGGLRGRGRPRGDDRADRRGQAADAPRTRRPGPLPPRPRACAPRGGPLRLPATIRRSMVRDRSRRAVIAGVATVIWLAYMAIGLGAIDAVAPTVGGEGPEGAAAFVGLVTGVITVGLIMWAASD